jgi:hypothetical protein
MWVKQGIVSPRRGMIRMGSSLAVSNWASGVVMMRNAVKDDYTKLKPYHCILLLSNRG